MSESGIKITTLVDLIDAVERIAHRDGYQMGETVEIGEINGFFTIHLSFRESKEVEER